LSPFHSRSSLLSKLFIVSNSPSIISSVRDTKSFKISFVLAKANFFGKLLMTGIGKSGQLRARTFVLYLSTSICCTSTQILPHFPSATDRPTHHILF
jgi:hypothetical protein